MRALIALLLALGLAACNPFAPAPPAPQTAQQDTAAMATVRALYGVYQAPKQGPQGQEADWSAFRTPGLATLYSALPAKQLESEEPILDFDPIVGGQDWLITELALTEKPGESDAHKIVTASFRNAGEPRSILFDMRLEGSAWKVDNVRAEGAFAYDVRQTFQQAGVQ
jgi:hypothetical protein